MASHILQTPFSKLNFFSTDTNHGTNPGNNKYTPYFPLPSISYAVSNCDTVFTKRVICETNLKISNYLCTKHLLTGKHISRYLKSQMSL